MLRFKGEPRLRGDQAMYLVVDGRNITLFDSMGTQRPICVVAIDPMAFLFEMGDLGERVAQSRLLIEGRFPHPEDVALGLKILETYSYTVPLLTWTEFKPKVAA